MYKKTRIVLLIVSLLAVFTLLLGCNPPSPTPSPSVPDDVDRARDLAIIKANSEGNNIPTGLNWSREIIYSDLLGGPVTVKYSAVSNGNWYIDITYTSGLSLENTDYTVKIQFDGMPAIWTGTITYEELYPVVY